MADGPFQGLLSQLTGAVGQASSSSVSSLGNASSVTIQTAISPPVTFTPNASGGASSSGGSSVIPNPLALLKPSLILTLPTGQQIGPIAPWGEPGPYLPNLALLGAGIVGGLALLWGAKTIAKSALYVGGAALAVSWLSSSQSAVSQ